MKCKAITLLNLATLVKWVNKFHFHQLDAVAEKQIVLPTLATPSRSHSESCSQTARGTAPLFTRKVEITTNLQSSC